MKFLAAILLFSLSSVGCNNHKSDYESLKINSGYYRIINHGNGVLAKENQYILYSLLFTDDQGKVFLDKRQKDQLLRQQVVKDSFSIENLSPVSELLQILSKGDSAILKIPLKKEEKLEEFADSDSLIFYINIIEIMDEKQVLDYLSQQFLNKEDENSRVTKEYKRAKELLVETLKNKKQGISDAGKLKTANGIEYYVLKMGNGENVRKGQKVRFDYITLTGFDEKEIENSYSKPYNVEILLGAKQEIEGWDEAVSVMNKNMIAVFFIPAGMAYGEQGKNGVIPPNTDLIYLIELNDILN